MRSSRHAELPPPPLVQAMQWFQVTCPSCAAALQVKLPEGVTSVQCSQCKAVFGVQVQPTALAAQSAPASGKRSRKRKSEKDTNAPPRTLSAYNVFMKGEVAKVKSERPELPHREAFKMVRVPIQNSSRVPGTQSSCVYRLRSVGKPLQ